MTASAPAAPCTLDLDAAGKHFGHVLLPHSRDDSAWGTLMLPIVSIKNGQGPTLLLTGGNHGDEYESQVALQKLTRSLEPERVHGQVIIVPSLNLPAALAHSRVSPIDGGNMNRVFPGDPRGSMTQRIAWFVSQRLIPRADVVADLHSGGKSLMFTPTAIIHKLDDAERMARGRALLKAFGAPIGLVLTELDAVGMMDSAVEDSGKLFLSSELGGAGALTVETLRVTERGIANLLAHIGLVEGEIERPESATRMMETPEVGAFVVADDDGVFEPFVELGDDVEAGQPVGQIHCLPDPARPPRVQQAGSAGTVFCRRASANTRRGDCLLVIAQDHA